MNIEKNQVDTLSLYLEQCYNEIQRELRNTRTVRTPYLAVDQIDINKIKLDKDIASMRHIVGELKKLKEFKPKK